MLLLVAGRCWLAAGQGSTAAVAGRCWLAAGQGSAAVAGRCWLAAGHGSLFQGEAAEQANTAAATVRVSMATT